jgi:hypothetical protein
MCYARCDLDHTWLANGSFGRLKASNLRHPGNMPNSLPTNRTLSTLRTRGFYGVPRWSAGSACSKVQVLNPDVYGVTALVAVQRQSVNSSRPEFLPMMRPVREPDSRQRSRGPRSRTARLHFLRAKLHFLSAERKAWRLLKSRAYSPLQTSRPHPSRTKKWGHAKEAPCKRYKRDPVTPDGNGNGRNGQGAVP